MMNLRTETLETLKNYDKTIEDIRFICSGDRNIPIDLFFIRADKEYDDGYGGAEVDQCLTIVGDDWWLERGEYDGSEWWEFKTMPKKPDTPLNYTYTPFYFDRDDDEEDLW